MKRLVSFSLLTALALSAPRPARAEDASKSIREFVLDEHNIFTIPVSRNRVTTISFPGPISALEGANVTVDGNNPAFFQLAHKPGSYFFSVRSLARGAATNVNVRWNNKTYVLELRDSRHPWLSVIFHYQPDTRRNNVGARLVSPAVLVGLLEKMKRLPLILSAFLATGCAMKQPVVTRMTPVSVPGTSLPSEGIESVRYSENIKAYPLGRYIDPSNSRIMHERHTIYRVETTPKWNLHPNAPANVPMGSAVAVADPSKSPAPTNDEIRAEISRQRAISRQMTKQSDRLEQHLENLRGSLDVSKTVAVQNLALKQKLIETEERVEKIEQKLEQSPPPEPAPSPAETIAEEVEHW